MLVANLAGSRVEASRDIDRGEDYTCPECHGRVVAKPGRTRTPHFAHAPGAACSMAGESAAHLAAKACLAHQFRQQGYTVTIEATSPLRDRRIDVLVGIPTPAGVRTVAVEVQDSKISVEDIKRRNKADRQAGHVGTLWTFTRRRMTQIVDAAESEQECRVPDDVRYIANRTGGPVHIIDPDNTAMLAVKFQTVVREGGTSEWYDEDGELQWETYPDRVLKSVKTPVLVDGAGFRLRAVAGRYHSPTYQDWTILATSGISGA
ncbi:competence protein CoiA family protein [Saccharomonospora azurea]|uniref:competence protein CoiA n=1 Tax=Saccharomonospora azurea TaxID=40988 RepID=UPI00332FE925